MHSIWGYLWCEQWCPCIIIDSSAEFAVKKCGEKFACAVNAFWLVLQAGGAQRPGLKSSPLSSRCP